MTIQTECSSCGGTGVYRGFAEPQGVGVACLDCKGSGCREISYTPFTKRKRRDGIKVVRRSRGSLMVLGVGPTGEEVSYQDFLDGKLPR